MLAKALLGAAKIAVSSAPDFKWAAATSNSSISITNDGRTATHSGAGNYQTAFAPLPTTSGGKFYWEVTETISNNYANVGVGNSTSNAQFYQDVSDPYYVQRSESTSFAIKTWTGTAGSVNTYNASARRWGFAYDVDSRKLWVRQDGGTWINSGDPTAGTSPSVTLTGTSYLVGSMYSSSDQSFTITSRTAQTDTAPSGFTAIGGTGTGGGGGGGSLQYKYGSCPGGTSMSGVTYSGLANGPFSLTLGTAASFTGSSGDRCVVVDLGSTVSNSNTTATQSGTNYFSVWTSTDGSSWTERIAYSAVGSSSSYTYSISSTSHRYVAYTSGDSGYIFNSIKVNSYS